MAIADNWPGRAGKKSMMLDRVEHRADWVSYGAMFFVAGWISCQSYYKLEALWDQRNALQSQVVKVEATCQTLRREAIRGFLEQQDEHGIAPDWSKIKPCPPVIVPKK